MASDTSLAHPSPKQAQGNLPDSPLIWVLSDGTAGMVGQALALAQALDMPYFDVRIMASPIYRLFPQMGAWPLMPISPRRSDRKIGPPWPDIIITCGKRTAGASLAIKRLSAGKTKIVQIQDPRIDPSYFDVMITPQHDPISQQGLPHVIVSKASLNSLSMTGIAKAAKALDKPYRRSKKASTAVMIGGNNKRYKPNVDDFARLGEALADFAKTHNRHLYLVPSRRTPKSAYQHLADKLSSVSFDYWDGKGANPYPGILGVVDDIIVTSDSVNMVSEACITGKPVYVAPLQQEAGRLAAFHQMMQDEGHCRLLGAHFTAPPEILDETKEVAVKVRRALGL